MIKIKSRIPKKLKEEYFSIIEYEMLKKISPDFKETKGTDEIFFCESEEKYVKIYKNKKCVLLYNINTEEYEVHSDKFELFFKSTDDIESKLEGGKIKLDIPTDFNKLYKYKFDDEDKDISKNESTTNANFSESELRSILLGFNIWEIDEMDKPLAKLFHDIYNNEIAALKGIDRE